MGFLKLVDRTATKVVAHGSGDTITLRANISKAELNTIFSLMPESIFATDEAGKPLKTKFNFSEAAEAAKAMFTALVVGWSIDVPATLDNYLALEGEPASWVDSVLFEHFNSIQLSKDEVGKLSTSPKGSRKGSPVATR